MLTDNQQELYDIIMNDEFCYNEYKNERFDSAISAAIGLSYKYGHPIFLAAYKFKQLKEYLKYELEIEK